MKYFNIPIKKIKDYIKSNEKQILSKKKSTYVNSN